MLPLNWWLNLFNTFSVTNHHNFALSVALLILVFHRRIFMAQTAFHGKVISLLLGIKRCRKDRSKETLVPVLLVTFIIIAFLIPASVRLPENPSPSLSISLPTQDYSLQAIGSRAGSELKEATNSTGISRKIQLKTPPLILAGISNSPGVENFTGATLFTVPANIITASWLHYACQLLDLPPPCFA